MRRSRNRRAPIALSPDVDRTCEAARQRVSGYADQITFDKESERYAAEGSIRYQDTGMRIVAQSAGVSVSAIEQTCSIMAGE